MMEDISAAKKRARAEVKAKIAAIPAFEREQASASACALLQLQTIWKDAKSILFFAPLPNEVNIWALLPEALKLKKVVLLPRFDTKSGHYGACQVLDLDLDLTPGKFGIIEPAHTCSGFALNQLDLVLVPGLAFAPDGRRLGRGGGFYDRLLPEVSGIKCGVAFDEQIVSSIPVEPHDARVTCILTPSRWVSTGASVC